MHLNCHTQYSLKYGLIPPKELMQRMQADGVKKFALTDINNTSIALDVIRRAPEFGLEPVLGIDFRNGIQQQYIGLAKNNYGFQELNEHLTRYSHKAIEFKNTAPEFSNCFVIYPYGTKKYKELRDYEFVGIKPKQLQKLPFSEWQNRQDKLVALQPVSFRNKRDFNSHRLLRAIDKGLLLSMLPKTEQTTPDEMFLSQQELYELYKNYPQIIKNTERLLNGCSINFDYTTNKNKHTYTGSVAEDFELLQRECYAGLQYRYGNPGKQVLQRLKKELNMIRKQEFCSYFLINWDMVNYARSKNYYYVGRGSGANSIAAYLLRITDVDPIELDLYFERFINPYRANPPDFDIDFSSHERNDVTKYLFDTHGWNHTALTGTYITFKHRSMIREIGKVFGLPSNEISKLQKGFDYRNTDQISKWVIDYSRHIANMPSHLSVHASGIIISDKPISTYTATFMPPKGFPTTHFSMIESEDVGLHKFDILGQRGLGKIKDGLAIVKENRGVDVDIHNIKKLKEDTEIKKLLKKGDAIGCFYVESPGMRMLLTKLKADDYLRLVAASSIIRPGVAQSGMMHEYVLRFHDKKRREEARAYLPELYEILEETYGVMVYQEDVIKVAHYFADLDLSEADVLRRGMSWKFRERNEFHTVKDKFFANCKKKNHRKEAIEKLWKQIESFGNYAFAKGHSASYAVESYQALYLKAHFPLEYMVATVNNGGGFYRTELYMHEARKHGGIIETPCVNNSEGLTVISGKTIYLGLGFMRDLERETINQILEERWRNGPYKSLKNFIVRVKISLEQLCLLIRVGAFRFTGHSKKKLLWNAHFALSKTKKTKPAQTLFEVETKEFQIPELWSHELEDAFDELELLRFTVNTTPFTLVENLPAINLAASDLPLNVGRTIRIVGYLVHIKNTSTHKGDHMNFGTWLDMNGDWIDTVHFPDAAKKYRFQGPGCYLIQGKVTEEFGHISIEVEQMKRLATKNIDSPSVRLKSTESYYKKPQSVKTIHA